MIIINNYGIYCGQNKSIIIIKTITLNLTTKLTFK